MIRLYLKILENLVRFIFKVGFEFVHTPFNRVVKLNFLAQFPVGHLLHPVMSNLIIFWRSIDAFAY